MNDRDVIELHRFAKTTALKRNKTIKKKRGKKKRPVTSIFSSKGEIEGRRGKSL